MKQGLVVDDSAVIRRVTGRILEMMGFDSTELDDGAKALDHCLAAMPDAILLDWNMPNVDTIELLRKLRRVPGGNQCKILFVVTENDPMLIGRALRAGADDILLKPYDHHAVQEKFEELGLIERQAQAS
ncbi:two-component system chemotaxis response regulator CheY [Rhodoblastus acidophilus]|uniref:response regulator n=1 Tax=Rhodoblastus acidophilus TaxID=1074 RepID=UPI0016203829|nr:response regulator [Rhodoblastus acidophilus]MCW2285505.1 two-component system chemotaxis response regulator CheY [Rhodoblastus acidophilus]MCW2334411.1 two-component system chemotaxis response regulator CheY [Rhodoblastus acidophilus]